MFDYIPTNLKLMWLLFTALCVLPMVAALIGEKRDNKRKEKEVI